MLSPPYCHVKMNYVADGIKPYLNDFWFSITGTFPGGWNVATANLALENHFKAAMLGIMNAGITFLGTDFLLNNTGIVATHSTYTGGNGNLGNVLIPVEVATIVRMQSSAAGRTGRGRIFISGLDDSVVDGGRLSPAGLTLANTIATACQTAVTDQGVTYHPAVYSRKDNILYNLQYASAEIPLGTQRRRRTRR